MSPLNVVTTWRELQIVMFYKVNMDIWIIKLMQLLIMNFSTSLNIRIRIIWNSLNPSASLNVRNERNSVNFVWIFKTCLFLLRSLKFILMNKDYPNRMSFCCQFSQTKSHYNKAIKLSKKAYLRRQGQVSVEWSVCYIRQLTNRGNLSQCPHIKTALPA